MRVVIRRLVRRVDRERRRTGLRRSAVDALLVVQERYAAAAEGETTVEPVLVGDVLAELCAEDGEGVEALSMLSRLTTKPETSRAHVNVRRLTRTVLTLGRHSPEPVGDLAAELQPVDKNAEILYREHQVERVGRRRLEAVLLVPRAGAFVLRVHQHCSHADRVGGLKAAEHGVLK